MIDMPSLVQLSARLPHLALRMREHCHRAKVFAGEAVVLP
jgi:hypothetical protein